MFFCVEVKRYREIKRSQTSLLSASLLLHVLYVFVCLLESTMTRDYPSE